MTVFTLVKHPVNNLYAVYEGNQRVKGYIFTGVADFEQELKFLGFKKPYQIIESK